MQESVTEERTAKIFAVAAEVAITRAIADEFYSVLQERAESDVILIASSPAGLTAPRVLSLMGYTILVIEQTNYHLPILASCIASSIELYCKIVETGPKASIL